MTQTLAPAKQKHVKIDDDSKAILATRLAYDGNMVRITGPRLDPTTYKRVDAVLQHLGAKWKGGKVQAHVFSEDAKTAITAALSDGKVLNRKQSYQFFETPDALADRMVELAEIRAGQEVLEPSAGRGAIVRAIRRTDLDVVVSAVEIDCTHAKYLEQIVDSLTVGDFLSHPPCISKDRVLMNPPFSGGQDADHVMRAFGWLRAGGRLVSIIGEGTINRGTSKGRAFREFLTLHTVYEEAVPAGAFAQSGTDVATRIIVLKA